MNEEGINDIVKDLSNYMDGTDIPKHGIPDLCLALNSLLSMYHQEKEKNKKLEEVIDMMADDIFLNAEICDKLKGVKIDCCGDMYGGKDCCNCVKEYYFNKAEEKENDK